MEVWKAAVLGAVQGLTEFLPVSSSGHLILFGDLLGADGGMFFDVMVHGGTLLAVLFFLAPRIAFYWRERRRVFLYLAAATAPAAFAGAFLGGFIDEVFFGGGWLWAAFALTALALLLCERRLRQGNGPRVARPLDLPRAMAVGAAQALAVIPGLSRSGATLAAGVFCGLSRREAADFSFLLSVPVIAGAICFQFVQGPAAAQGTSWQALCAGGLSAALFGALSVRWMLRAVQRAALWPFALYLLALAAALAAFRLA